MAIASLSSTSAGATAPKIYFADAANTGASTKETKAPEANGSSIADEITLSPQAQAVMANAAPSTSNPFAKYFPRRDGDTGSTALADGVTKAQQAKDLAAGAGKTSFQQVAIDARASMDAKLTEMSSSGQPFDVNSWEGKDWYSLMGDLDRRALYAVRSNEGGLFTPEEQEIAQSIMGQQQGLAMGLYAGPTSQAAEFVDPFMGGRNAERMEAAIKFLDGVSDEEKSSIEWAAARAAAQTSYEIIAQDEGKSVKTLDSENPLAKLIASAMKTMKDSMDRGWTVGTIVTADDLKAQPWFKGFEDQLDQILRSAAGET